MLVPFFRKALINGFKESHEKVIRLPEDDPEVVEAFLVLLLEESLSTRGVKMLAWMAMFDYHQPKLTRVYILADKLGAEAQQNRAVDILRTCWSKERLVMPGCLDLLLEAGLEGSKMFELLILQLAFDLKHRQGFDYAADPSDYPLGPPDKDWFVSSSVEAWVAKGGPAVQKLVMTLALGDGKDHNGNDNSDTPRDGEDFDHFEICDRLKDLCKWHTHETADECDPYIQEDGGAAKLMHARHFEDWSDSGSEDYDHES